MYLATTFVSPLGQSTFYLRGLMKASLTPSQSTAETASNSKTMADVYTAVFIRCLPAEWTREVLSACGVTMVVAVTKGRHGIDIANSNSYCVL